MGDTRLALIIDDSESFVSMEKERFLKEWDALEDFRTVNRVSEAMSATIFGDSPASVFSLTTPDEVKSLVQQLEALDMKKKKAPSGGLVIPCTVSRRSTKKLEALVTQWGGEIITLNAGKGSSKAEVMVNQLHVDRSVKKFLVDYAGQDHAALISVIWGIREMSEKAQKRLTVESVSTRLPAPPGSVPPWELEKPLYAGNVNEMIQVFRRIVRHTHPLVPLAILKRKAILQFRIASLIASGVSANKKALSTALDVKDDYPFTLALQSVNKLGMTKCERILSVLIELESDMKGGSSVNDVDSMEVALIRIASLM